MDGATIGTAAQDLIRISAPSTGIVILHKVIVTNDADETSQQAVFQIHRASTDGTGTAATPRLLDLGSTVFGGTAAVNQSVDTTAGDIIHREAVNLLNGFYWVPTPEERIILSPSGRIVVRLDTVIAGAIAMTAVAYIEEIGT